MNGDALEASVQFANDTDVDSPNATLSSFIVAVTSGSFDAVCSSLDSQTDQPSCEDPAKGLVQRF